MPCQAFSAVFWYCREIFVTASSVSFTVPSGIAVPFFTVSKRASPTSAKAHRHQQGKENVLIGMIFAVIFPKRSGVEIDEMAYTSGLKS